MDTTKPHFEPSHPHIEGTDTEQFRALDALFFIDETGKRWEAPIDTLTDGASIPQLFLSFIGDPMSQTVRAAAVVHDAYCGVANKGGKSYHIEPWQKVHRMFYEGLLACSASKLKALTMYAAVRLGGPRWEMDTNNDVSLSKLVPEERLVQEMKHCKTFIEERSPSIDEVDEWMKAQESKMLLESV